MTVRQFEQVRSLLGSRPRVTRTEIHRSLGCHRPPAEISHVLNALVEAGHVRVERDRNLTGRSMDYYCLVEDTNDWLEAAIASGQISDRPWTDRAAEKKRWVYFIQASGGGLVKIGVAYEPEVRLRMLQCGCPVDLQIIGLTAGGPELEESLHQRFASDRVRGEWFRPSEALLDYISRSARLLTAEE